MRFEWDEKKNNENIRKHGLDFADAWQVFGNPLLAKLDERENYGEDRWIGIGMMSNGIVVVLLFTEREQETIRIISMRKATKNERTGYEKAIKTNNEIKLGLNIIDGKIVYKGVAEAFGFDYHPVESVIN